MPPLLSQNLNFYDGRTRANASPTPLIEGHKNYLQRHPTHLLHVGLLGVEVTPGSCRSNPSRLPWRPVLRLKLIPGSSLSVRLVPRNYKII